MANETITVKAVKIPKSKRLTEDQLAAKYSHMVPGTLAWDELNRKQYVTAKCEICGEEYRVFTSDLFQVKTCELHRTEAKKAKRAAYRKAQREAYAAWKASQAETEAAPMANELEPVEAAEEIA